MSAPPRSCLPVPLVPFLAVRRPRCARAERRLGEHNSSLARRLRKGHHSAGAFLQQLSGRLLASTLRQLQEHPLVGASTDSFAATYVEEHVFDDEDHFPHSIPGARSAAGPESFRSQSFSRSSVACFASVLPPRAEVRSPSPSELSSRARLRALVRARWSAGFSRFPRSKSTHLFAFPQGSGDRRLARRRA